MVMRVTVLSLALACLSSVALGQDDQPPETPNLEELVEKLSPKEETAPKDVAPAKGEAPQPRQTPSKPMPPAPAVEEQIDKAIARAVEWLSENQKPDGGWGGELIFCGEIHPYGSDVCGLMALAYAGAPATDARVQKALRIVLAADLGNWPFSYAMRTRALSRLHPQLGGQLQSVVKKRIQEDVKWLIEHRGTAGGWRLYGDSRYSSFLETAWVATSLDESAPVVGPLPRAVWQDLHDMCLAMQLKDGGWQSPGFTTTEPASDAATAASPTAAGLVSLLLAREKLFGPPGCPCDRSRKRSQTKSAEADEAIERALAWLDKAFDPDFRRVPTGDWQHEFWRLHCMWIARTTGLAFLGTRRCRTETVHHIVSRQLPDGSWGASGVYGVAFNVTCLREAAMWQRPMIAKLRFPGEWNNHPTDMRNLTAWLSEEKNEPLGWHAVPLEAPLEVWQETPILYLSAEEPILPLDKATKEEKEAFNKNLREKLRRYTDAGGTILVEASCGAPTAAAWWENLAKDVWPEWPLKPIDRRNHPLWTADARMTKHPLLLGIDDGLRTCVLFSRADISCDWNTNDQKKGKPTFDLGRNLYACATDRMRLAEWCALRQNGVNRKYAEQLKDLRKGPKDMITVARVEHGDEGLTGANYTPWRYLAADLEAKIAGLTLKEAEPVAPGEAVPGGVDLLYLTGRSKCDLGEGGPEWLKDCLAKGGFLVAEATLGDPAFEEPLKAALAAAGLALEPMEADMLQALVTGKLVKVQGYDCSTVAWTPALAEERADKPQPVLWSIFLKKGDKGEDKKLVGLYSPYDILFSQTGCRAFGNRGYSADDARALATNIVLLVSAR